MSYKLSVMGYNKGVAALPTIILIAMVILLAAVGVASSGFIEGLISYGELESKKTLFAAEVGARDAFERVVRNKRCNIDASPSCSNYSLDVGDAIASIVVSGSGSARTIVSTGQIGVVKSKIQVEISFDANDKAVQTSWRQITN